MGDFPLTADEIVQSDICSIAAQCGACLDELSGKEVLFTGGAGFIGYLFVQLLSRIGDDDGRESINLTIYENFIRGRKNWLAELANRPNVLLVEHDVTNPIPGNAPKYSHIIHAASIASPVYYRKFPIETIDANVDGLRHLLNYAQQRKLDNEPISKMLYFSTSEVYGDPPPEAVPTAETYRGSVSCTGPRACYDESKRLGETLCVNFAQQYGVPVSIVRPFNNYGPGDEIEDKRLLADLAGDLLSGRDLVLYSDGSATRTFCYISDAIAGYIKALVNGRPGEPYNIGTETPELSVREFADKVARTGSELFGYEGEVAYKTSHDKAYLTDNPSRRCPNISKAKEELDFMPGISLDEGLRRALVWYKENQE